MALLAINRSSEDGSASSDTCPMDCCVVLHERGPIFLAAYSVLAENVKVEQPESAKLMMIQKKQ